jgi:hypothetical protein
MMLIVFWDVSVLQYNIRIVLLICPLSRRQKEEGKKKMGEPVTVEWILMPPCQHHNI